MPRQSRIVVPDIAHHITQRGNYRQKIFEEEKDYKKYTELVAVYSDKYKVQIIAYCLIANHVHFIVIPKEEKSLARLFNTVHMRYSQYMNKKRGETGHLWQGRFYSCILDNEHLYNAVRYVERNPVRTKVVKNAWEYQWSSASMHVGEREDNGIKLHEMESFKDEKEWKEYLEDEDKSVDDEIRLKTQRGLVVGGSQFIKKLEKKLSRSLTCLNPGRPKKEK